VESEPRLVNFLPAPFQDVGVGGPGIAQVYVYARGIFQTSHLVLDFVFHVDDDAAVRQTLQLLMESAGFRAECVASAEEFQRIFDSSSPDCVVIDMGLPGMSGIALLEELRRKGVTTPVILFLGSDDATLAARAIEAGAQEYCAKSVGSAALLDSVCKANARTNAARARSSRTARFRQRESTGGGASRHQRQDSRYTPGQSDEENQVGLTGHAHRSLVRIQVRPLRDRGWTLPYRAAAGTPRILQWFPRRPPLGRQLEMRDGVRANHDCRLRPWPARLMDSRISED